MPHLAGTTERDRDAGLVHGALLSGVPAMIVITIVVAVPILPAIARAFPDQPNIARLVTLVAVLPTLALALTSLAAGALGGMVGRRRLLILGTAVFAVSAILPIWLSSFMLILVSRAVTGLALGVMIPSAVALTGDYYSGAKLQQWLGAQSGVSAIVGVLVGATSGALGELSWRYAFLPLVVGALLLVGLVAVRAPATTTGPARVDSSAAPGEGGKAPWLTWLSIFGLAVVSAAIIYPPGFELGALLHEKALGSSLLTGLGISLMAGSAAVAAFSLGWLRWLSIPAKAALAMASAGVGTLLMAEGTSVAPMMVGMALVGVSHGTLAPVLSAWLLERTPRRLRGHAVGVYTTLTFVTLFVAPLVARWAAVDLGSSSAAMRLYMIADFVVAAVVALMLFRPSSRAMASAPIEPS
ncbi:MAG: MFS transporter [Caulobacteraceae bacterium]